jgi:hypothetical protein
LKSSQHLYAIIKITLAYFCFLHDRSYVLEWHNKEKTITVCGRLGREKEGGPLHLYSFTPNGNETWPPYICLR